MKDKLSFIVPHSAFIISLVDNAPCAARILEGLLPRWVVSAQEGCRKVMRTRRVVIFLLALVPAQTYAQTPAATPAPMTRPRTVTTAPDVNGQQATQTPAASPTPVPAPTVVVVPQRPATPAAQTSVTPVPTW